MGEADAADRLGHLLRTEVPEAGVAFLRRQPWLLLAAPLGDGSVWPSLVSGRPGFLDAPAPGIVTAAATPPPADPLGAAVAAGGRVGALALEPASRRRLRLNGRFVPHEGGLAIRTDEVVSNCPKYIQRRRLDPAWLPGAPAPTAAGAELSDDERRWIAGADTLFLATAAADGTADMSHRGGRPGFVAVHDGGLSFDELPGNSLYMTLGNLEQTRAAGLLFVDFATGATLHVAGRATVDYGHVRPRVTLSPVRVLELAHAAPAPWSSPEYSPHLDGT
jgi:predicted pyridoxine 5'-phosphate oxidase superfamily flavin-nucleotide-binding protein